MSETNVEANLRFKVARLCQMRRELRYLERDIKRSATKLYRAEGLLAVPPLERTIARFG